MPLSFQQRQGLHGEGFLFAMASSAGLLVTRSSLDVDGVDWLLAFPGPAGTVRSPKIEAQVKTWSKPQGDAEAWHFRMSIEHFNALAGRGFELRRYLVLITVPDETECYARCDDTGMCLSHAAYWVSLVEHEPVLALGTGPKTRTVLVPKRNLLSPATLRSLVRDELPGGGA